MGALSLFVVKGLFVLQAFCWRFPCYFWPNAWKKNAWKFQECLYRRESKVDEEDDAVGYGIRYLQTHGLTSWLTISWSLFCLTRQFWASLNLAGGDRVLESRHEWRSVLCLMPRHHCIISVQIVKRFLIPARVYPCSTSTVYFGFS